MKTIKHLLFAALIFQSWLSASDAEADAPAGGIELTAGSPPPQIFCSKDDEAEKHWNSIATFKAAGQYNVYWRRTFRLPDNAEYARLLLTKPEYISQVSLNGQRIEYPLNGMRYSTVTLPASLLKTGENIIEARWTAYVTLKKNKQTARVEYRPSSIKAADVNIILAGLTSAALQFKSGPVLGYVGTDFFTVSCWLNMPAKVTLQANSRTTVSDKAVFHRFKVGRLKPDTAYKYTLTATLPDGESTQTGPYIVHTLPKKAPFTFAIMGDSRSNPKAWQSVAEAAAKEHPILTVFVGDMVTNGRHIRLWLNEFLKPAKDFLATTPLYSIIGNHEDQCPIFSKLFITPTGKNTWTQQIGPVLLIGIDGSENWEAGSENVKWLEKLLKSADAKYIFLNSHYPAWSSGCHTVPGRISHKVPREILQARDVILPLLKKYNATAMFAGHDHFYERSEPDNGVTMIVTGGAGAPLRDKVKNAAEVNPYSKVFNKSLHFCILKVNDDTCTMRAITPDGMVIDKIVWPARKKK